jgi:hypothetical protein
MQNHVPRSGMYNVHYISCLLLSRSGSVKHRSIFSKIAAVGSSVTAYCFALTMEHLFSPCTLLRDLGPPEGLQELNLDVSTDEFLSAERGFTYADLFSMLRNRNAVAWLTSHAAVARNGWGGMYRFHFDADGKAIYALARSPEHLLEICDVVLQLLAASAVHSVVLNNWCNRDGVTNAPPLAYLMEQCQSLKALTLNRLEMDENHCRVLGAYSRPDLEIILVRCKLTSAGASALAEVLGRNQGPTKLDFCFMDNSILANGLRGNSRLKSLVPSISNDRDVGNQEVLAIAGAVRENKGLVYLDLWHDSQMSDETWDEVCDYLETHPTLKVLDLRMSNRYDDAPLTPTVLKSRIQALLDMMKVNMSIHTIHLIPVIGNMSFSEGRSFLISRRIDSDRAFLPSRRLAQFRTVPRFWQERFCQLVRMPIAFGCFCQGIHKLLLRRETRRSRRLLRTSLRLLRFLASLLPRPGPDRLLPELAVAYEEAEAWHALTQQRLFIS